jgi:signal transduction histidine kinase
MMARQTHCRDDIEFLLKEANRISKIVNGMRKLTRVSGRRKVIEMNALLSEALATMEDGLRKRKITSKLNLCPENPQILADRDELLQVFTNLIHNSMQAIDDAQRIGKLVGQPPMVWLDTNIVESKNQMRVLVRICDNGPGMPEDIFQKIFDAGFTTKSAEEGTGLGLSICRRFIRAFEGDIIVEKSIPGVQTTFLIDIPEVTLDMTGEVHATV